MRGFALRVSFLLLCSVLFTWRQTLALFELAPGEHLNRNKSLYADEPKLSTMRYPVLKLALVGQSPT